MSDRNPIRDLPMEEVSRLVSERLPHRAEQLEADRLWLWLPCPDGKPSEADRTILKQLGFGFTPRPHPLGDGTFAFWFHPCGGAVLRRRRRKSGTTESEDSNETQPAQPEPAVAAFLAWAQRT